MLQNIIDKINIILIKNERRNTRILDEKLAKGNT